MSSNIDDQNITELTSLLAKTENRQEIENFFKSILTPKELHDIGLRWELVKRLDQGETQRSIARDLHISLCKITRGSRELKKDDAILKRFIDRLNK
jgi:TrpR family trp operon transcriptional repressor